MKIKQLVISERDSLFRDLIRNPMADLTSEAFEDLPDDLMNPENWKKASPREKFKALVDAGIIEKPFLGRELDWMNNTPGFITGKLPTDNDMPLDLKHGSMDLNQLYRDALKIYKQEQHDNALASQEQDYEIKLGPEGRAELKAKAEELAELKRQQRRKEALEDAELAFQRAETVAQRQAEMEKIKRQYQHDLDVIDRNHRSNMEAIRTGNDHELNKMDREHRHEKDMWDRQNPRKPGSSRIDVEIEPDLGPDDDDEKQSEFDQFKQDLNTIAAPQSLPGPDQKPPKKPSRYDNSDAQDVDFREPDRDDDRPPRLALTKEDMARLRDLITDINKGVR